MSAADLTDLPEDECLSCTEGVPGHECSKSMRPCGHHCNHSWVQDCCHWCGAELVADEDGNYDVARTTEREPAAVETEPEAQS